MSDQPLALPAFVLSLLLVATLTPAQQLDECKVVGVADGDTITVLDAGKTQHKIRLAEIDAAESGQAFGTQSKKALSGKVFGKTVSILVTDRDRYGRLVGRIYMVAMYSGNMP